MFNNFSQTRKPAHQHCQQTFPLNTQHQLSSLEDTSQKRAYIDRNKNYKQYESNLVHNTSKLVLPSLFQELRNYGFKYFALARKVNQKVVN